MQCGAAEQWRQSKAWWQTYKNDAQVDLRGRKKKQWTLLRLALPGSPPGGGVDATALQGGQADESGGGAEWLMGTAGGWDPHPIPPVPSAGHILHTGNRTGHGQRPAPVWWEGGESGGYT